MTLLTETLIVVWLSVLIAFSAITFLRTWKRRRAMVRMVEAFPGLNFTLPIVGDLFSILGDPNTILERGLKMWRPRAPRMHFWLCHLPIIALGDPDDLETILSSPKHGTKPYTIYRLVECFFGRGLLTLNGTEWRGHRKAITPSFHFSVLERYCDIFLERAEILNQRMRPFCDGADFDLLPLVATTSNETICETAFGWRATGESKSERETFIEDMESAFRIMQYRALHPWFLSDTLFGMTKMAKQHKIAEDKIRNYASNAIRLRKQALASKAASHPEDEDEVGTRQRYSFLDLMLTKDNGLTEEDILGEVRTLIGVQETSSTTLCFALLMLAMHQDIQSQVLKEIAQVWSQPNLTSHQKLNSLHLQDRVLKETLRLFPPVPLIGREATSDIKLSDGKVIPGGSFIALFVYGVHRDPKVHSEPEKFNPDRFLPENCAGRHPYSYIPFSAGPRNCVGQKYAMLQMKSIVTTLVRRYQLNLPEGGPTRVSDLRLSIDTFLKLVGGFRIRISERPLAVAGA